LVCLSNGCGKGIQEVQPALISLLEWTPTVRLLMLPSLPGSIEGLRRLLFMLLDLRALKLCAEVGLPIPAFWVCSGSLLLVIWSPANDLRNVVASSILVSQPSTPRHNQHIIVAHPYILTDSSKSLRSGFATATACTSSNCTVRPSSSRVKMQKICKRISCPTSSDPTPVLPPSWISEWGSRKTWISAISSLSSSYRTSTLLKQWQACSVASFSCRDLS
jgi:hypothetical protein